MNRTASCFLLVGVVLQVLLVHAVTVAEADRLFDKKRWHEAAKAYDELATRKAGGRESRMDYRSLEAARKRGHPESEGGEEPQTNFQWLRENTLS